MVTGFCVKPLREAPATDVIAVDNTTLNLHKLLGYGLQLAAAEDPAWRRALARAGFDRLWRDGRVIGLEEVGPEEADWAVKKGGVWWFAGRERDGETQAVLRAVLNPDFA